jgi:hypothetical protein
LQQWDQILSVLLLGFEILGKRFLGFAERFGSGVEAFGHILYRIPLGFLDHILHILRPRTFVWVGFLEGLCHSSNILC